MKHDCSDNPAGSIDRPPIDTAGRHIDDVAAEHVVQGLLEFLHRDDIPAKDRRVARVLDAVRAPRPAHPATGRTTTLRFPILRRWALASAALIALCTALVFIGVPGESSALAELRRAIAAMKAPGERRYEIRMIRRMDDGPRDRPDAVVDSSGDLLLIRHTPPWLKDRNAYTFAGRNAKGPWAIRDNENGSEVIRDNPERDWPPFITDGGESFMLSAIGDQLDQLPRQFTFLRLDPARIEAGGRPLHRLAATRTTTGGPMPTHVDLWIDPDTHLVERVEYRWENAAIPAAPGAGAPDRPDAHPPMAPGETHDGDDDRPSPADGGHDGDRGPGGPPGRPHAGLRPRLIIFQRIEAPPFPADWFTPESHIPDAAP